MADQKAAEGNIKANPKEKGEKDSDKKDKKESAAEKKLAELYSTQSERLESGDSSVRAELDLQIQSLEEVLTNKKEMLQLLNEHGNAIEQFMALLRKQV